MDKQRIIEILAAADSRDPARFCKFFTEDVSFRFGNGPTLHGIEAVEESLSQFYDHVVEMRHSVVGVWQCDNTWTVETVVHYTDRFGRSFTCPACTIMFANQDKIYDYRIFVDNSAMFLPPDDSS